MTVFNNIYVSSLDIVNSIYVRVFVRLLHLAATCRVLMFMLGVHNTDKLQAGKKNTNMDPERGCATPFVF